MKEARRPALDPRRDTADAIYALAMKRKVEKIFHKVGFTVTAFSLGKYTWGLKASPGLDIVDMDLDR